MQYKSVVLIDGENLVLRYQDMLNQGYEPLEEVIHIKDTFVWNPEIVAAMGGKDIVRAAYYTTVVGDDTKFEEVKDLISESEFVCELLDGKGWYGTLVPHVYKKTKKGSKTKSVDINLTIDALRYANGNSIEQIVLITGDGDYIPLLREVMSKGKMVQVFALSSGLNKDIKHNVDDLVIIDNVLFESEVTESEDDFGT